jgi:hypothetical protein
MLEADWKLEAGSRKLVVCVTQPHAHQDTAGHCVCVTGVSYQIVLSRAHGTTVCLCKEIDRFLFKD